MDCLFAGGSGVGESGWLHCTNWAGQSIQIGWRTVTDEKTARKYLRRQHLRMIVLKSGLDLTSSGFIFPVQIASLGHPSFLGDSTWGVTNITRRWECVRWELCDIKRHSPWVYHAHIQVCIQEATNLWQRFNCSAWYVSLGRVNPKLEAMCRWSSFFPLQPSPLPQGIACV